MRAVSGSRLSIAAHGRVVRWLCRAAALAVLADPAGAASYPARPVRLVVPFPPGGTIDIVGRILAERLAERLGHSVVVDNRGGAGGALGADVVAKAAPDGHTLLLCSGGTLIINPLLAAKPLYDGRRDFASVSVVLSVPYLLLVRPAGGFASLQDLIAQARQRPEGINYATAGSGSSSHLAALLFSSMAGIRMIHVPYKGSAQAITEMMSGQTQLIFEAIAAGAQHVRAGRLRALGVTALRRSASVPEVPTFGEAGMPGFEMTTWHAICAPGRTPEHILDHLNREIVATMAVQETRERLTGMGADIVAGSRAGMRDRVDREFVRWEALIRDMGLRERR